MKQKHWTHTTKGQTAGRQLSTIVIDIAVRAKCLFCSIIVERKPL